jgi:peptidoglycan/LPS O-acetylase OafA/YrhL
MKYRREIDGLRAVAVLPVVLYHAGIEAFSGGFVGVDIFFVISGYLITTIILSEIREDRFSIITFYERRARRILPALFFVMLCCLPFAWLWLLPKHYKEFSESIAAVSVFSSNIFFREQSGYFSTAAELKPLLHTWSLAVEEQFYIFFPPLLMLLWRKRKTWMFKSLVTAAVASLAWAHWGAYHEPSATFFLLPTRAWELAIGALIAFYFLHHPESRVHIQSRRTMSEVCGFLGVALICLSILTFDKQTPFPSLYALLPTVGTALIIVFSSPTTVVGRILGIRPMVGIGLISYSTYLWHQPLFVFARHASIQSPDTNQFLALSGLSFILAWFSWRFVEKPFRDKQTTSRKQIFSFALLGSLIFAAVGLAGHFTQGFPSRIDETTLKLSSPVLGATEECDERKKTTGKIATIGDLTVESTIALVGDSHSTRLTRALSEILLQNHKAVNVYSRSWGVPLLDVGTDSIRKKPQNRAYMQRAYDEIVNNPHIDTVILSAQWANYTEGRRYGNKEVSFYTDSLSEEKSLTENVLVFKRGLKRTLDALTSRGIKVIIVGSVPEYQTHVPDEVAKNYFITGKAELRTINSVTKKQYMQRNSNVEPLFRIISDYKNTYFISPFSLMCVNGECSYRDNDFNIYYQDSNHLSYYGSKIIVDKLKELL